MTSSQSCWVADAFLNGIGLRLDVITLYASAGHRGGVPFCESIHDNVFACHILIF